MKYRRVWPLISFVILVGVFILVIQFFAARHQALSLRQTAMVTRVVDGDTIRVLINNREDTVRLVGIDAPETVNPGKFVQCFGREASDKAKEILNGKTIVLESDSTQGDRDEYGRLLRYVFLDNLNFNQFMIGEGYAREYTFKSRDYKYKTEFIQAEVKAKGNKKGLWADNICD